MTLSRTRRASRPLSVAAICAVMAIAAGCSSSGTTPAASGQTGSAAQALAIAARQASKASSYSATISITSTGSNTTALAGTVQVRTKPTLLAHEKFSGSTAQLPLPGGMELILTGNTIYLKMSALSQMVGKPWVKLDLSALKNTSGLNLASMFRQFQTNNPLTDAQMFAASTNVRRAGSQVINGVPTTEYTGTYQIAAGLARLSPSLRQPMQQALAASGIKTSHFTIWVDGQHQVRKLVQTESGSGTSITTSMLVTSINQPLTVQLPPASQVAAMPGL